MTTRQQVLDTVNRHRERIGQPPVPMRRYDLAVRIARHHRLISEEHLEWARLGYFPTPAERAGGEVRGARPPFPRPGPAVPDMTERAAAAIVDLMLTDAHLRGYSPPDERSSHVHNA